MRVFKDHMRDLMHNRELSVDAMDLYTNSTASDGFRAQIDQWREAHGGVVDDVDIPEPIRASRSTVLRWMHCADAVYGRHVKGFTDRRNDPDIMAQLQEYSERMGDLEKRMPLWTKLDDGTIVPADRLRSTNSGIEECTDEEYDKLRTFELDETPPSAQCGQGHDAATCRCTRPAMHWGHDEVRLHTGLAVPHSYYLPRGACGAGNSGSQRPHESCTPPLFAPVIGSLLGEPRVRKGVDH